MKRKMELSELIFKIIAYVCLTIFSLMCVYPLVYSLAATFSDMAAMNNGKVILLPKVGNGIGVDARAFQAAFMDNKYWIMYANTLFMAFIGTVWCMFYTILGAYALSKKRLMGRKGFNFFLVFTMWFSAGVVASTLNYGRTAEIFASIVGKESSAQIDLKWLIIIAMGMNATNLILLRNSFEGVPSEIEEAARIDGATELQVLTNVFIPMSKATIATVALFFGISRWNGYFWAYKMIPSTQDYSWPVQVYIRDYLNKYSGLQLPPADTDLDYVNSLDYSATSCLYAMVILAVVPILAIYPFIQKYFAKGVNMGGVKE